MSYRGFAVLAVLLIGSISQGGGRAEASEANISLRPLGLIQNSLHYPAANQTIKLSARRYDCQKDYRFCKAECKTSGKLGSPEWLNCHQICNVNLDWCNFCGRPC